MALLIQRKVNQCSKSNSDLCNELMQFQNGSTSTIIFDVLKDKVIRDKLINGLDVYPPYVKGQAGKKKEDFKWLGKDKLGDTSFDFIDIMAEYMDLEFSKCFELLELYFSVNRKYFDVIRS